MSHVDPCPPRPGTLVKEVPALLRLALVFALSLAPVSSFAAGPPSPRASAPGDSVQIVPAIPCSDQDVRLVFTFCTCNMQFVGAHRLDLTHERIDVVSNPLIECVQCNPDTVGIDLGRFPLGHHRFEALVASHDVNSPDSTQVHVDYYVLEFDVVAACGPVGAVPFLTDVQVGGAAPCDTCPPGACAGDSIMVFLRGGFPDASYAVIGLEAINDQASPIPIPPTIRIVYSHACTGGAVLTTWSGSLPIAPLPRGSYRLPVEAYLRDDCNGSFQLLGQATYPFAVGDDCPPPAACFTAGFLRDPTGSCDAFVGPDRPGVATLAINSGAGVGGVQGRLVFDRPGLRVLAIDPAYVGSILKWEPKPDGATFVLVLPTDAPIPRHEPRPLLVVRAALEPGLSFDGVVRLLPVDLLVSDPLGIQVPLCFLRGPLPVYEDISARFCPEEGCDFNGDHHADVRDLVLMVNCIQHPLDRCAGGTPPDCDGDHDGDLDDVLCCARVILGGARPDSAQAVPAPEVTLEFGAPIAVDGGVDVPVLVGGRTRIGATRLQFTYSDAVFASASIELAGRPANWLALDQGGSGRLTFGGIRIGPDPPVPADVPSVLALTLHLRTRAGQSPAGDVAFVSGDFSDADGAMLVTSATPVTMPVAGGVSLALSAARPNPFGAETRFRVALTQDADLDVTVYDLAGRRVTTLFRGRATAGTREFTWRRTRDDGSLVPSGVYFYRATSGGEHQGGKVLVLSRN